MRRGATRKHAVGGDLFGVATRAHSAVRVVVVRRHRCWRPRIRRWSRGGEEVAFGVVGVARHVRKSVGARERFVKGVKGPSRRRPGSRTLTRDNCRHEVGFGVIGKERGPGIEQRAGPGVGEGADRLIGHHREGIAKSRRRL